MTHRAQSEAALCKRTSDTIDNSRRDESYDSVAAIIVQKAGSFKR